MSFNELFYVSYIILNLSVLIIMSKFDNDLLTLTQNRAIQFYFVNKNGHPYAESSVFCICFDVIEMTSYNSIFQLILRHCCIVVIKYLQKLCEFLVSPKNATWISHERCLRMNTKTLTKMHLFIFGEFQGPAFELIKTTKAR